MANPRGGWCQYGCSFIGANRSSYRRLNFFLLIFQLFAYLVAATSPIRSRLRRNRSLFVCICTRGFHWSMYEQGFVSLKYPITKNLNTNSKPDQESDRNKLKSKVNNLNLLMVYRAIVLWAAVPWWVGHCFCRIPEASENGILIQRPPPVIHTMTSGCPFENATTLKPWYQLLHVGYGHYIGRLVNQFHRRV